VLVFRPRHFPPYAFFKGGSSEGVDTILSEGWDGPSEDMDTIPSESRKFIF
jgi:hypothetical protein